MTKGGESFSNPGTRDRHGSARELTSAASCRHFITFCNTFTVNYPVFTLDLCSVRMAF